jgi:hypothetical protein
MGDAPRHFTLVYTGQLELAEVRPRAQLATPLPSQQQGQP